MDNKIDSKQTKKLSLRRKEVLPLKSGIRAGSASSATTGACVPGGGSGFC